ncbi:MAG: hypothetical protein ACXW3Z_01665, partial [Limisphaerales bacterium]
MIFPFHSVVLPTRIFLTICSALTVLLGAVASRGAEMDPGTVDASFDAGWSLGRVVRALALQPDGKLVVGTGDGIYRLNSDGSLDPSFNGGVVMTDGDVLAVALQPDGRIVVGGRFRNVNGTVRGGIARINSDGSVDSSFLGSTSGTDGRVAAIALQADGRLLVGGNFTNFNGSVRNHITRLNADGTLDNTFTPSLVLLVPEGDGVNAIVPLADGKLLIGGGFTTINGTNRNYLARLNASGSLDTTFLNGLNGPSSVVKAVVLQPDGKVLIGGDFTGVNGVSRNRLARLNANGSTDATFGNGLSFAFQFGVSALALQADGKVLAGGGFFGPPDFLVRMNSNGTVDSTFSAAVIPDNSSLDAPITSILVHPDDGKIIIGGTLLVVNSVESKRVARLEASGAVDTTFDTSARGINGLVNTAALHSNGRILIGGAFTRVNGVPRSRFARLNADGTLDTTFPDTAVNGSVNAVAVSTDGKIIIAGDFNRVHGIDRVSIARLNSDGTLDATFLNSVSGVPGGVNAVALQPDGKVLIGGFFRFVNSIARTYIARLNADGTLDNGFQSIFKFSGSLNAIAVRSDGKILVGGRLDLTNNTGRNFVALNTNGSQDTDFIDPANWYVNDIKVQTDSKTLVGGIFGKGLARLNADGSADGSFLNNLQSPFSAQALALQPDGKVLIAGPFAFADGFAKSRVARLLLDGSGDSTFTSTLRGTDQATFTESYHRPLKALIRQPDGKILVAGEFTLFDGVARSYIARLHGASVYRPGEEIIRPPNAPDINNRLSSGPTISPAGLGYWDAASFRLYAGNSGSTNPIVAFITWKNAADQDVTVPIVIIGIAGQQYALGDEIVPPSSADVTRLPATGPDVQPATAAFWHNPTRKLYAADAGGFTVVWRNSGNAPIPMQAVNLWPTNETLFQTHVAGTPPVNLGAAGTFGSAKLLAQTVGVGADPLDVQNGGTFSATGAGRSLVLLSAGNPQESPDIYFQFVKSGPR